MIRKLIVLFNYIIFRYLHRFSSEEKLQRWQKIKIKRHLKFIKKHSPYYKKILQNSKTSDLNEFPIINKKTMMDFFNEINTVGISLEEAMDIAIRAEKSRDFEPKLGSITVGLSSGTSGNRGVFLADTFEQNLWAGAVLAKTLPEGIFKLNRVAFFMRANSNLYTSVSSRKVIFRFFDILIDIEKHIEPLNKFNPNVLVGAPSVLKILAIAKQKGFLKIEPKKIISVAEVLEPLDKNFIEAEFHQIVHQVYQCTEGFLGYTCKCGTIHMNEDIVYIEKEYIDEQRFYPIITDFRRASQPIIRYRLNDILVQKEGNCPCGSCFMSIEKIEGREDDIFYFPSIEGNSNVRIFPDFIRNAVITASDDIDEYMVVQENLKKIVVQLKLKSTEKEKITYTEVKDSLEKLFENYECKMPQIDIQNYKIGDMNKKLIRVRSIMERGNVI